MAKSADFQYAQSYTAGQLVAKMVENYAGASRESAQGMELLLKVAKQYENVAADKTQGRLFEIIETTKFNVKAAELGETIRAATTDSLGDPHAATFGEQLFHAACPGAVVGGGIGVISEGIQFVRGEKALLDSMLDAGKKAVKSAANGAAVASLAKGIVYIGKDTFLVRGNVATAVASSTIRITQLTVKYIKGELSSEEYIIGFGENGVWTCRGCDRWDCWLVCRAAGVSGIGYGPAKLAADDCGVGAD